MNKQETVKKIREEIEKLQIKILRLYEKLDELEKSLR